MEQRIKIALVGKKKVGRTFAATYVRKRYKFRKWALNDGVKRIYRTLYDYHQWQPISWERQNEIYDFFYKYDADIWVKFLERRLDKSNYNIIIDDVRYVSEVKYLQALGFVIVRVTAPDDFVKQGIAKQLGKSAAAGSMILHEYFARDDTKGYQVDYSIHNETRDGTRAALDSIMKNLTEGS